MDYRGNEFKSEIIAPKSNIDSYVTESVNGKWEIVKHGKLNHFFLSAFDIIYHKLALVAATFEAPFTLSALQQCTDSQLESIFKSVDIIPYWADVEHDIKAKFLYNFFTNYTTITTDRGLTSLIQYVFNDINITGQSVSIKDNPHNYDILIDITGTEQFIPNEVFTARLIEFVNNIVPVTEKLRGLTYIENAKTIDIKAQTMTTNSAFTWSSTTVEAVEPPTIDTYTVTCVYKGSTSMRVIAYKNNVQLDHDDFRTLVNSFDITAGGVTQHVAYNISEGQAQRCLFYGIRTPALQGGYIDIRRPSTSIGNMSVFETGVTYILSNVNFN